MRLGERVLADLTALVDRLYPAADVPEQLSRDAAAHRAFGAAQTLGHVRAAGARRRRLDAMVAGGGTPAGR